MIERVTTMLAKYPLFGSTVSLASGVIGLMDVIEKALSILGVLIGIAIGAVTLIIKLRELSNANERASEE